MRFVYVLRVGQQDKTNSALSANIVLRTYYMSFRFNLSTNKPLTYVYLEQLAVIESILEFLFDWFPYYPWGQICTTQLIFIVSA